ncbi:RNA polymerase sigma factor [Robertkochia flava]|uniref:RNA polymerase sigma factor n=1 Tax=Robertkochia flava TaxID=3447986 RepID=UPI001CCA8C0B|nr:RNA polymerase sigma-70 factor [Robertkochia marina]
MSRFKADYTTDPDSLFNTYYQEYYTRVVAFCCTYTQDQAQAEDITQQAFLRLWKKRHKLHKIEAPLSYLFTLSKNIFIDEYRRKRKANEILEEIRETAIIEEATDQEELIRERFNKVAGEIENLPEKCRNIVVMNKLQGYSYQEISEALDISVKTVESQMRIAFKKLREAFKDDELFLFFLTLFCQRSNTRSVA